MRDSGKRAASILAIGFSVCLVALCVLILNWSRSLAEKARGDPAAQAEFRSIYSLWDDGYQRLAEILLDAAVQQYPKDQRLAFFRAANVRSRFDVEASAALFGEIAQSHPLSPYGKCSRLIIELDSKREVLKNLDLMRALVENNPDDTLLLWMLCVQCRARDRAAEGARRYGILCSKLGVGPAMVHQTYANILESNNKYHEALPHRMLAVKLEPEWWTYEGLGSTSFTLGYWGEAKDAYDLMRKAGGTNPIPKELNFPASPSWMAAESGRPLVNRNTGKRLTEKERRAAYREQTALYRQIMRETHGVGADLIRNVRVRKLHARYGLRDEEFRQIDIEGALKGWYVVGPDGAG